MRRSSNDSRQALEFVTGRIIEEARREGDPLTEAEREMLSYSALDSTEPVIPECDSEAYEKKIAGLVRNAYEFAMEEERDSPEAWTAASRVLCEEDFYLGVMLDQAGIYRPRPKADRRKLLFGAVAICILLVWLIPIFTPLVPVFYEIFPYIWMAAICLTIAWWLVRLIWGKEKADESVYKFMGKLFGIFRRSK